MILQSLKTSSGEMSFAAKKRAKQLLATHWHEVSVANTEDGQEKLCTKCSEWWPLDPDFFCWLPSRNAYHSWCKACDTDKKRQYRKRFQPNTQK
jgi:hypothetical protein